MFLPRRRGVPEGFSMDEKLLEILVCPLCKASVRLESERLVCGDCGRRYPVRDGIPIMIADEAEGPESGSPGEAKSGD
jgi:uncharacterized protein YbaR (Trm112 family)